MLMMTLHPSSIFDISAHNPLFLEDHNFHISSFPESINSEEFYFMIQEFDNFPETYNSGKIKNKMTLSACVPRLRTVNSEKLLFKTLQVSNL